MVKSYSSTAHFLQHLNCAWQTDSISHSVQPTTTIPLGPVLHVYRDRPFRWLDLFMLFIPASLAVIAPLLYGLKRDIYARSYYGPVAAQTWSWPWYALATVALIPLLLLALGRVRKSRRWVELHKNGLKISWTGNSLRTLLWNQILGISCSSSEVTFLGRTNRRRHQLTLHLVKGKLIHIDDHIRDLPELIDRIKAKIYPQLLPKMRTAFNKGETLNFGPVIIHQNAIKVREQQILWNQVTRLNVESGKLIVESLSRHPIRIPTRKIPNVELLIQVLQEGVNS